MTRGFVVASPLLCNYLGEGSMAFGPAKRHLLRIPKFQMKFFARMELFVDNATTLTVVEVVFLVLWTIIDECDSYPAVH